MLFNKVLGENEKRVFYFYLKTEGTFWPTQYDIKYVISKHMLFLKTKPKTVPSASNSSGGGSG